MPSKTLYHTHAWVDVTSAQNSDLAKAGILPLLNISDSASLDGQQSIGITLAGRTAGGTLWSDLITPGDLISIGAQRVEEDGSVSSASLAVDAVVQSSSTQEAMQQGGYSMTTSISASGLQSVIQQDAVAWWMFYGTTIGALRAKGELLPDNLSGRLDKVLAAYMNKIALNFSNWERDKTHLGDRLGYYFHSLTPNVPILYNLTIAEGAHWEIMSQYAELSLHEFFVQMRAPSDGDRPMKDGYAHNPGHKSRAIASSANPGKHDGKRPYVVLRPKPYPSANRSGQTQMSDWNSLFLHDLGDAHATIGQRGFSRSRDGVRNFTMVYPGYDGMNEEMSITNSLAVWNAESVKKYGYSPAKFRTNLVLNTGSKPDMLGLALELTWRVATQTNRMDEMMQGSITVPLSPKVQPGDRVKFRLVLADGTPRGLYQGYVTSRSHQWTQGQGGTTTISLERILPHTVYQNPKWFTAGLERASIKIPEPSHSAATAS